MENNLNQKSEEFIKKLNSKPKFIIRYGLFLVFISLLVFALLSKNITSISVVIDKEDISEISYATDNELNFCTFNINENRNYNKTIFKINEIYYFIYSNNNTTIKGSLYKQLSNSKFVFKLNKPLPKKIKNEKPIIQYNTHLINSITEMFNSSND